MTTKVLVSGGFGAGWSTWNYSEGTTLATDVGLVALVEAGDHEGALAYVRAKWPSAYTGGLRDCHVDEVPTGALYQIREYDGSESLVIFDANEWSVG